MWGGWNGPGIFCIANEYQNTFKQMKRRIDPVIDVSDVRSCSYTKLAADMRFAEAILGRFAVRPKRRGSFAAMLNGRLTAKPE